jgi:hypothetical protein
LPTFGRPTIATSGEDSLMGVSVELILVDCVSIGTV